MFGGYDYDPSPYAGDPSPYAGDAFYDGDYYLEEESFDEHYGDEIEDRVIPALDFGEVTVQQLTLFGGAY